MTDVSRRHNLRNNLQNKSRFKGGKWPSFNIVTAIIRLRNPTDPRQSTSVLKIDANTVEVMGEHGPQRFRSFAVFDGTETTEAVYERIPPIVKDSIVPE